MIVILEGPDGSGKTFLARRLAADLDLQYHHEGPPPFPGGASALNHYGGTLDHFRNQVLAGTLRGVVIDRFARGELIYGPILRDRSELSPDGWRLMKRLYVASGVVEILCLPSEDVCLTNWTANLTREHIRMMKLFERTYRAWKTFGPGTATTYDYTEDSYEMLLNHVEAGRTMSPPRMVGNPLATHLIVGEQTNGVLDLPFFATDHSSKFLNDALEDAGYREDQILLANALNEDGKENLIFPELLLPDKAFQVIALGGVAANVLTSQGISSAGLPHPQYWKRFHASERDQYVAMLKAVRK